MTSSAFSGYLSSEYDPFLSSPLWMDRNESPLTVMSALARLDIDPWAEAAALAALSKAAAIARLSALLGPLPGAPSTKPDRENLCQRVLCLLPGAPAAVRLPQPVAPTAASFGAMARARPMASFVGWMVIAALIGAAVLPRLIDTPAAPVASLDKHASAGPAFDGSTTSKE
jgi:hypothetical protein